MDNTVVWYYITKVRGNDSTHQELTAGQLRQVIVETGFTPVERDGAAWRVTSEPGGLPCPSRQISS